MSLGTPHSQVQVTLCPSPNPRGETTMLKYARTAIMSRVAILDLASKDNQ